MTVRLLRLLEAIDSSFSCLKTSRTGTRSMYRALHIELFEETKDPILRTRCYCVAKLAEAGLYVVGASLLF